MADEYTFKLGMDAGSVYADLQKLITALATLRERAGKDAPAGLAKAEAQLVGVAGAGREAAAGITAAGVAAKDAGADAGKGSAEWQALKKRLDDAAQAYREYRRETEAGNAASGGLSDHSAAALEKFVATHKAATANFVGDIEKQQASQRQLTATIEREVQQRAKAYSAEHEAMLKLDAQFAPARSTGGDFANSGGNVTANSRNTAATNSSRVRGVSGTQQFQAAYAAEQSKSVLGDMRAYYAELERTSAAEDKASNAASRAAASQRKLDGAVKDTGVSLPRLRYALYDVSTFGAILGAGMAGAGVAVLKVAADYDKAFASVRRTLDASVGDKAVTQLRADLIDLSTQIPVTYGDITKIATAGNQLGVPAANLTGFTEAVAKFSTTTGVSTDTAATAFGRLGKMLKTTDYHRIGDEIAYLGVHAVATEGDIIKVSGQIAATTTAYGFSEKQTLALATAYASLGIKAESARGTTSRTMNQITAATQLGGTALAQLGAVTGMTGDQFKKAWSADTSGTFTKFVQGLGQYGSNARNVLKDLGITASRDTTSLMLLAQNSDQLTEAQKNSTQAAGAMNAMFAKQSDTVAAQLEIANNRWMAFVNSIGSSANGPVRMAVDGLNALLDVLNFIAHSPVIASVLAITLGLVALGGAAVMVAAGMARFAANMLAVQTFQQTLAGSESRLAAIYQLVTKGTTTATSAQDARAASAARLTAAIESLTGAEARQAAVQAGGGAAGPASAETASLKVAGNGAVVTSLSTAEASLATEAAAVNLALAQQSGDLAAVAIQQAAAAAATAEFNLALAQENLAIANANRETALESGTLQQLTIATAAQTRAQMELTAAQEKAAISARELATAQEANATGNLEAGLAKDTAATSKLSGALGKAGLVGTALLFLSMVPDMVNGLADWERQLNGTLPGVDALTAKIQGLTNAATAQQSKDALKKALTGFGGNDRFDVQRSNGKGSYSLTAGQAAVNDIRFGERTPGGSVGLFDGGVFGGRGGGNLNTAADGIKKQISDQDAAIAATVQKGDTKGAAAALKIYDDAMKALGVDTPAAEAALTKTNAALNVSKGQSTGAALAAKNNTTAVKGSANAYSSIIKMALAAGSAQSAVAKSLNAMGKSFVTNGVKGTIYGGALQKTLAAILAEGGTGPQIAGKMQILFDTLVKGGYASAQQLIGLKKIIAGIGGGKVDTNVSLDGLDQLTAGYNKAADAANKQAGASQAAAAATVRTLSDYANDLNTVMGSSLTYRFGATKALDAVNSKWLEIKQASKDAHDQLKGYMADLKSAKASRDDTAYYLGVAQKYGDQRRVGDLQAQLGQKNKDVASAQKQVNAAQIASSKSLKGNTQAAIQNRSTLYEVVDGYKDYITSLAQSGATQGTLSKAVSDSKQQFMNQATQLGYNRTEVGKIAASFDDFAKIVKAIPRNITTGVTANTNPALAAIADYKAQAASMKNDKYGGGTIIAPKVEGELSKKARGIALQRQIDAESLALQTQAKDGHFSDALDMDLSEKRRQMKLGLYRQGGYTGDGPTNQAAGIVHGQEFVLNAIGQRMFPRAALEAANQGRAPIIPSMKAPVVQVPANLTVSLSTLDRMLLGGGSDTNVSISGDSLASATDQSFQRSARRGSA